MMRHTSVLFVLMLVGCSTHPIVDTLDFIRPGKMYPNEVEPYGGVLIQQGSILTPGAPGPPTVPGIVPPPVPLPGTPGGSVPPPPAFPPTGL
jgi:hypothetical protein